MTYEVKKKLTQAKARLVCRRVLIRWDEALITDEQFFPISFKLGMYWIPNSRICDYREALSARTRFNASQFLAFIWFGLHVFFRSSSLLMGRQGNKRGSLLKGNLRCMWMIKESCTNELCRWHNQLIQGSWFSYQHYHTASRNHTVAWNQQFHLTLE